MTRLIFDIAKTVLVLLVMNVIVCDGKSLLCHVIGLFNYSTWVAIVQEILQHKLKYFGNICCLVFVIWVARRINRHGRPRLDADPRDYQNLASKTLCHTSVTQQPQENKSDVIFAYVSYEVMTDDRGSDKDVFMLHDEPATATSCGTEYKEKSAEVTGEVRSVNDDEQEFGATNLIDSSFQTQTDESRDTSGSILLFINLQENGSEVGFSVDVKDDEHKAVAVPVRLTKTRIVVAAGVVGLGGYLCWRLFKR